MNDTPVIIQIIQDLANITSYMNTQFKDEKKVTQWLNTKTPAGKTPTELIFEGQTDKLREYIECQTDLTNTK